jgi:hypothetical protein
LLLMNLRNQLLKEHTKNNRLVIVKWIGDSQQRFDELVALFLHDEYRVAQRAAWPLSYVIEANPRLIKKHLPALLKNLKRPGIHGAVRRNTVRLLQYIVIPPKFQGEVMNLCFEYINSPAEEAAVKAFSLTVLANLARAHPAIIPELRLIIEERWDHEPPSFRARAKKLLREFS